MPRPSRRYAFNPLWNHYQCKDGRWLAFAMAQADRWWADFARAIGRPELSTDERFATMVTRGGNCAECVKILDGVFASRDSAEWIRVLTEGGDFIFTIVNSLQELPDDPQVAANELIGEVEHPTHGPTRMLKLPIRFSETPPRIRSTAPEFGQHTEQVLVEELGYTWEQIATLKEKQVI